MATSTQAGTAIALAYGYVWVTGQRLQYYEKLNTGDQNQDFTRVGFWGLGDGEWDGCEELWDTGLEKLLWTSEFDDPAAFHFHRGCDAVIGENNGFTSIGPDQGLDTFWADLPSGIQPLNYHRIAYYAIKLKQLINNPPNTHQDDASVWADVSPIGLWRAQRCRLFDGSGRMNGYAFTTNPAWHWVDLHLRRKVYPEYGIDLNNGADDLTTAVRNRFDWGAISAAADAYDIINDQGNRQCEGNYAFSQQTSMQACLSQILQCCRSYQQERNGKIALLFDQARPSVFTFSRKNSDKFTANDTDLHSAANRYVAKFRDLLIPAAADISSISFPDHQEPTVFTLNPHPFANGDRIVIGGTNTKYDTSWLVDQVPDVDEAFSFTMISKGSNYPTLVGSGGTVGLLYSRFKDRAPEFNHHQHQYAKGAIGLGIPRQRNKLKVETDFATSTYDQVSRLSYYQRARALGPDVSPYVPPVSAQLDCPLFAEDEAGSGNLAIGIEPGDHVIIDDTLSTSFAGDYEVVTATPTLAGSTAASDSSLQRSPVAGSLNLTLRPYSDDNFFSTSNPAEAGWEDVPGSQPGNDNSYSTIDLADGTAAFFSGSGTDSTTFSMPTTGFNAANLLAWASPQGFVEGNAHLHFIGNCGVDVATRLIHMVYSQDDGAPWIGDANFAALTWRTLNSARRFSQGGMDFVELTLAGGELVCFGMATGSIPASTAVPIPAGYTLAQSILLAFPHTGTNTSHPAHGFCAYVSPDGVAHHMYQDGEGNVWQGDTHPFYFGYKNNMGTVTWDGKWVTIPLSTGKIFAAGGFSILDANLGGRHPTVYPAVPLTAVESGGMIPGYTSGHGNPYTLDFTTLQTMTGPNAFDITGNDAHGVKECLVDGDGNALCSFEDGEGNVWYGGSGLFALLCDTPGEGAHHVTGGPTGQHEGE